MTPNASRLTPGDRFDISNVPPDELAAGVVGLDPGLQAVFTGSQVNVEFREADGRLTRLFHDPARNVITGVRPEVAHGRLTLECVSLDPLGFILVSASPRPDPSQPPHDYGVDQTGRFTFSERDAELLGEESAEAARLRDHELSLMGSRLGMVAGFDELLSLQLIRDVEPLEFQRQTAHTVLRRFRGRALMADEVGLGKTIEACMVLLELIVRGLVRRVLVLTPPSLIEQWRGELQRKFALEFVPFDAPEFLDQGADAWSRHDRILASFHTAKREPHRSSIVKCEWDMVIIDEVHHFRNRTTLLWKLAASLKTKYMLALTATPVQNNIEELYSLVTLVQPGLLHTARGFQRAYADRSDKLAPKNIDELHRQLFHVMIRNRRATTGMVFTHRIARTVTVDLTAPERELYDRLSRFVHSMLRSGAGLSRMSLMTLQKELGSSTHAALATLRKLAEEPRVPMSIRNSLRELAAMAQVVSASAKLDCLVGLVKERNDRMLVFTQYRESQAAIARRLHDEGIASLVFHGGLARLEKEGVIRDFQDRGGILVATDAGSEGRNLQFCNAVCNFDLPWNPMRIEQRIGRLSRIGQHRDVYVFNLVAAGTLESAILHLLEAKIAMFELVVGEIDMILGTLEDERQFDEIIADLWVTSEGNEEFRAGLDRLGERLLRAKQAYTEQRELDDRLFGDAFGVRS